MWSSKIWPKCYDHLAMHTTKEENQKRAQYPLSLYLIKWILADLGHKMLFCPLSPSLRLMIPRCMILNQNLQFFTFRHFLHQSASSASILDIVWPHDAQSSETLWILNIFSAIHQSLDSLYWFWYANFEEKFSLRACVRNLNLWVQIFALAGEGDNQANPGKN